MTAQLGEIFIYQGEEQRMYSTPLEDYFSMGGQRPGFQFTSTALWRGYVGTWEIIDDRLYLIAIDGYLDNGQKASLASIFPSYPERVFAHWFTGNLRIPNGEMLEYVHMGYASTYEEDLFLEIEKGVVKNTCMQNNK